MTDWKLLIDDTTPLWTGIASYAEQRIAELTAICVTSTYTDAEIRAAQAGIAELRALLALPQEIRVSEKRKQAQPRKGY